MFKKRWNGKLSIHLCVYSKLFGCHKSINMVGILEIHHYIIVGEEEELKGLILGSGDLEKKMMRGLDEVRRLRDKTEKLINR